MIFHITSHAAWQDAQAKGEYTVESLETEGFIHCSTATQVLPVAEKYYAGQSGLLLLVIEPALLSSTLKWEDPSGGAPPPGVAVGESFPHIYGPINLDAVINTLDLVIDTNGAFQMPKI